MSEALREQIENNYKVFQAQLPSLVSSHRGKFALMRDGKIIEFFDTARDAYVTGQRMYASDLLFSVQEVAETPIDLGFFSHAMPQR